MFIADKTYKIIHKHSLSGIFGHVANGTYVLYSGTCGHVPNGRQGSAFGRWGVLSFLDICQTKQEADNALRKYEICLHVPIQSR